MPGSSPLTRGGPGREPAAAPRVGLIPAYAGRTQPAPSTPSATTAHPRLRGADVMLSTSGNPMAGSSPLTRGGRRRCRSSLRPCRLIPAYAGRTLCRLVRKCLGRAHPRLRGADCTETVNHSRMSGSSPLTRGGRRRRRVACLRVGLIPAYAGRTLMDAIMYPLIWAHPRLRGADSSLSGLRGPCWGSSPLTRGGLARSRSPQR